MDPAMLRSSTSARTTRPRSSPYRHLHQPFSMFYGELFTVDEVDYAAAWLPVRERARCPHD
jgi:hypothetical protein